MPPPFDPSSTSVQTSCTDAYLDFIAHVPQATYFQAALEHLLPTISQTNYPSDSSEADFWTARCFCAYILYKLYTPHPIVLNPFRSVLEASAARPEEVTKGSVTGISKVYNDVLGLILGDRGAELDAFRPRAVLEGLGSIGPTYTPYSQPRLGEQDITCGVSPDPNIRHDHVSASAAPSLCSASGNGNDSARSLCRQLLFEAQTRVLNLSEQRRLLRVLTDICPDELRAALRPDAVAALTNLNGRIASAVMARILRIETSDEKMAYSNNDSIYSFKNAELESYVDALSTLPPMFSSFDVIGNLLRLERGLVPHKGQQLPVIQTLVVERFILNCMRAIDEYEREEQGIAVDDEGRTARAVRMVAKFALAVLKSDTPEPAATSNMQPQPPSTTITLSEGLDVELTNFALQHSRLVEANTLYRILASRFISQ